MSRLIHLLASLWFTFLFFSEWFVADWYNNNAAHAGVYVLLVRHRQMMRQYNRKINGN